MFQSIGANMFLWKHQRSTFQVRAKMFTQRFRVENSLKYVWSGCHFISQVKFHSKKLKRVACTHKLVIANIAVKLEKSFSRPSFTLISLYYYNYSHQTSFSANFSFYLSFRRICAPREARSYAKRKIEKEVRIVKVAREGNVTFAREFNSSIIPRAECGMTIWRAAGEKRKKFHAESGCIIVCTFPEG